MNENEDVFKIDNDKKADWALQKIREAEKERDRLIELAKYQIDELNYKINELKEKCDNDTAYFKSLLAEYFGTVPHKETKTQESYKLLSGTLVMKKPGVKIVHNDEELFYFLDGTDFIETKKTIKWGEYKKLLKIVDGKVVDTETGEVVEACTVEETPGEFTIKF